MAPSPIVSMTTANCGWPITWRSTTASSKRAEGADRHHGDQEGEPIIEPPPDHRHVGDEGAQHEQIALGKVDELRCLVNQHDTQRDQAIDASRPQAR